MANRFLLCAAVAGMLLLPAGCALVDTGKAGLKSTWSIFKPRTTDYRDPTEEEDDPFAFVGKDARGDRPRDKENAPLDKWIMSRKARNISRNLGYE